MVGYSDAVSPWAISASSAQEAWIVGSPGTRAWQWNGEQWRTTPMPHAVGVAELHSVVSVAAGDAWAVGSRSGQSEQFSVTHALIEHWDGTRWAVMSQPEVDPSILFAVAASDERDVWAVGATHPKHRRNQPTDGKRPLIERWDGSAWRVVAAPWMRPGLELDKVSVASPTDVWVVATGIRDTRAVALEHWNGSTWTAVRPPFGTGQPILGFAATSATDAWAVGGYQHHGHSRTLAAHWDGDRWAIAPTPNHNTDSALSDVVAISPTDAWAMGSSMFDHFTPSGECNGCGTEQMSYPIAFFLHWDGRSWTETPAQAATTAETVRTGLDITASRDGTAFAVGGCRGGTIIMRWSGSKWQQTRHPGHPVWLYAETTKSPPKPADCLSTAQAPT
jgi:hypothetical protein